MKRSFDHCDFANRFGWGRSQGCIFRVGELLLFLQELYLRLKGRCSKCALGWILEGIFF